MGKELRDMCQVCGFEREDSIADLHEQGALPYGVMLGLLLVNEVVCANEDSEDNVLLFVNCSDAFVYASSDAERIDPQEIYKLFAMWLADPEWADIKWCSAVREQQPNTRTKDKMIMEGAWEKWMNKLNAPLM